MLVEAHDTKIPSERILGKDDHVLKSGDRGLISRLVRQCLIMTDLAQPYVIITDLNVGAQGNHPHKITQLGRGVQVSNLREIPPPNDQPIVCLRNID